MLTIAVRSAQVRVRNFAKTMKLDAVEASQKAVTIL